MQKQTHVNRASLVFVIGGFLAVFIVLVGLCMAPQTAEAKSYSMTSVDIQAEAASDGSLNVVEKRTFEFNGSYTAVWWTFEGLPSNAQLEVNSVSMARTGAVDPAMKPLDKISFDLEWREEGGPARDGYSVDSPMDTVYVFFTGSPGIIEVELNYTIVNGVIAYKDTSDVYWQFVSSAWAEDSQNVTMTLTLPVPEGETVVAGENVQAWAHGPLTGEVSFSADGSLTYVVDRVTAGNYAEARVLFPREWLTDFDASQISPYVNKMAKDSILQEEAQWADEANAQRNFALGLIILFGVISVALIVWAALSFNKYGKEYPPQFTEKYWRDAPSEGDHPLVVARVWRWKKESRDDLTAELMYLSHLGAIQMHKGSYQDGRKTVEDYYLVRVPAIEQTLTNPIDIATMKFLFEDIAAGGESLWFKTIEAYGKKNPNAFVDKMKEWQGAITAETNKRDFFEFKGERYQMYLAIAAIVYAIIGIFVCIRMSNFFPLIFIVPAVIVLLVIANYMPRRSPEGNLVEAKSQALRNWLKDFSAIDERPPTDVKVWGVFMVYAFIFGIAKQVIKALQLKVPELFEDVGGYYNNTTMVPWWIWYSAGTRMDGGIMPAASDMFNTSVANTFTTAQAAISAASGSSSSGGGFGGGFSGGGGGGFGGGGGAR